jgi:hypothetical protein
MGAKWRGATPRRPVLGQPIVYSFSSPYRAGGRRRALFVPHSGSRQVSNQHCLFGAFAPFHVQFRTVSLKLLVNRQSHGRRRVRIGSKSTWQRNGCEECDALGQKTTSRSSRRTRALRPRSSRLRNRPNVARWRCGKRRGSSE